MVERHGENGRQSVVDAQAVRAAVLLAKARDKLATSTWAAIPRTSSIWAGGQQTNNMVMHHFAGVARNRVWVSAIEHPCVFDSSQYYFGKRARLIPVTAEGVVDIDWITTEMADTRPGLVAVLAASNETGIIQPVARNSRHLPGVQFFLVVRFIDKLPCGDSETAIMSARAAINSAGRAGRVFEKSGIAARSHRCCWAVNRADGWSRNGKRGDHRGGSGSGSRVREADFPERASAAQIMAQGFDTILRRYSATIVGASQPRLWNTVSALMPDGDRKHQWVIKLDKVGFAVSLGSACTTGGEEPSHVLSCDGPQKPSRAVRSVRCGAGWETTESDWHALVAAGEDTYLAPQFMEIGF